MNVGYIRVSSVTQNLTRQLYGVELEKVFEEKVSAKTANRPQLKACLDFCRQNDVLHCHDISRLARNLGDLINIVDMLLAKGVTIHFHKENMVFEPNSTNPMQTLYLQILGAIYQAERTLILERQKEGIAIARMRNAYKNVGRKPKLSPEQITDIKSKKELGIPVSRLARDYKVSRQTIYESIKSN